METAKQLLKILVWLVIGGVAGYFIGTGIGSLISGNSFDVSTDKISSMAAGEGMLVFFTAILAIITGFVVLVSVHEAGHLVAGLATGYKFVSFRIFNLTFIRMDGKMKIKSFGVAGTGGQCLLLPPDKPLEDIPSAWYNAGGVLANIMVLILGIPILLISENPFVIEFTAVFLMIDLLMILSNGIPMKLNGLGNDGYNLLHMHKDLKSKKSIIMQLRANALIQQGLRPVEMPSELFRMEEVADWKNPLEVSLPLAHASLLVDRMEFDKARSEFEEMYGHRNEIMQLYNFEIAGELAFCAMVTGDTALAERVLEPKVRKYIQTYSKVMSGKQRILFAMALYLEGDIAKASEIFRKLESEKDKYLLQGEVRSDLAIMRHLCDIHGIAV